MGSDATREIYWNVSGQDWIYPLALAALGFALWAAWRRVRLWRLGASAGGRLDRPLERIGGALAEVFGHRRLLRDRYAGVAHLLIVYAFVVLLGATGLIAVQEWSGVEFLRGRFYLGYSLVSDVFGLLGMAGLGMALWRRAVRPPAHLESLLDDWLALGLLLLIFAQGFLIEGLRIAATELHARPELAAWSPGGALVALALQGLGSESLRALHRLGWWLHALTVFGFLAWAGWGKLAHAGYGLLNLLLRSLDSSGRLVHADIEAALEADSAAIDALGVGRIEQLSWKDLLDLDACMQCGRCEAVCPAHLAGGPLSPRKLIADLRQQLDRVGPALLAARGAEPHAPLLGPPGDAPAVLDDEVWACRTCGACQRECPVHVEHVPKLVDLRRSLVMMEGRMSEPAERVLRTLDERLHPWTGSERRRDEWFADLDVKLLGRGERAEWLFWVGCAGAMVERNIAVTRALARVLSAAGVDFAVLGDEEVCSGDPARRLGSELGFQTCAKRNVESFERYGVRRIVTACSHCFNTLRNEYPDFGGHYEVVHHTQLIRDLLATGRLKLARRLDAVTYHDPCYLGRHGGEYAAPRRVLDLATRALVEPERSRSRALCCGAGGGHAWLAQTQPVDALRFDELRATGASTVAVACPFCMQMLDDARSARDPEGSVRLADVAELVAEALEPKASSMEREPR